MKNTTPSSGAHPKCLTNSWLAPAGGALVTLLVSAWLFHMEVVRPSSGLFTTDVVAHLQAAQE